MVNDFEKSKYFSEGYLLVKNVFTSNEMNIIKNKILSIDQINDRLNIVKNKQNKNEHPSFDTIFVWNDTNGNDIFAKLGKSNKILDRMSYIYDDDVYCYHNKITVKYPGIVGFNPHQDYYYWNNFGVQYPEAHAAFIAIDECTLDNGCLKIIPKSHLLGTLPHDNWGRGDTDFGIKKNEYKKLIDIGGYDPIPMIMQPGDVVFFHGNTIHLSDDNNSNNSRLAMLVTLNTKKASPLPLKNICGHPYYVEHERVHDPIVENDLNLPLPDFLKNF